MSDAVNTVLLGAFCKHGNNMCLECFKAGDSAEKELENWKTWGVVEIAVRNPNVAEYCKHWEGRAEAAESRILELEKEITALKETK